MKARLQLRKPENWQDFESLCKKLWGEIWKCSEIKKNGRQGQAQQGVDVYGIPSGEDGYFGIQCKAKDGNIHAQLTKKEVDLEISNALKFEPPLKKLYIATTANKDAKIEAHVRKKNLENKNQGLFEVHLFSWEDIADLIEDNKQTFDYFVRSLNHKVEHSISLTFDNNKGEKTYKVPFARKFTSYRQKIIPANHTPNQFQNLFKTLGSLNTRNSFLIKGFNHSLCKVNLRLLNTGHAPLKDFKILLDFHGELESINSSPQDNSNFLYPGGFISRELLIENEQKRVQIVPTEKILVPDDCIEFDTIYIKPYKKESELKISWKLISLDFKEEGNLNVNIIPEFKIQYQTILVEDPFQVREEETIEDFITDNEFED